MKVGVCVLSKSHSHLGFFSYCFEEKETRSSSLTAALAMPPEPQRTWAARSPPRAPRSPAEAHPASPTQLPASREQVDAPRLAAHTFPGKPAASRRVSRLSARGLRAASRPRRATRWWLVPVRVSLRRSRSPARRRLTDDLAFTHPKARVAHVDGLLIPASDLD